MKINEIFYSLQGEGKWSGRPNIFIRTTGCNLRCSYCDTKYAYNDGTNMEINDILREIKKYPCRYICITGGEPLLQEDIDDLIKNLLKKKYFVIIETNGSKSIKNFIRHKHLIISLDVKCPTSEMHKKNRLDNIKLLRKHDQIKFVIKNKDDYNYAKNIFYSYKPACEVFFQSVWGKNPKKFAEWIISDGLNVKLNIQLHKVIWGSKKGV